MKQNKKRRIKATSKADSILKNSCPACGHEMKEAKRDLLFPINGEEITVTGVTHLRCPECNEILLRLDEARALRAGAIAIYRKRYDLLSGDVIRALRERLNLTQVQLAELLRLGVNTLSRWESGRNVQTAAMDVLLRLVRDVPGNIEYLRGLAA